MNGTSLLAILRLPFCCLECFSIDSDLRPGYQNPNPWNWNSFSNELKDALSNIVNSSNLKTLSLMGISKLPFTFFLHIVHLTTLNMYSLALNDFSDENSSSLTRAASTRKGKAPMTPHSVPVIDRCIWRSGEICKRYEIPSSAYFWLIQDAKGFIEPIFLPFMCRLRFFEININLSSAAWFSFDTLSMALSFLMGSLCTSFTSPATLEHLKLNILFDSSINVPDHIILFALGFYHNLRDHANIWSHLDSVTTHPTGSRLQRVDININCTFVVSDEEASKAVRDALPLLCTKGILFVKTASV